MIGKVDGEELGFGAGLQDEVSQIFGGMVYMDFRRALMEARGYGDYVEMDPRLLPPLYLAYMPEGKEKGQKHSDVRQRWHKKDPIVVEAMAEIARCAEQGKEALEARDGERLFELMNLNFDWRRKAVGDAVLGRTLEMVLLARSLGLCAKNAGSGGAIIGICDDDNLFEEAAAAFKERGFEFGRLEV